MIRLFAFLALLPTFAAAEWSPRPLLFTYDAAFDLCTNNPDTTRLSADCADALAAAYALKRAVALAAYKCQSESLVTCAAPFEDEGLPAIAVRIAVDTGCDATDVLTLPKGKPLPSNHCISVASDIMTDEGIVPLSTAIACGIECGELALLNASFWVDQVDLAAPADVTINDLQTRNSNDCATQIRGSDARATDRDAFDCLADRSAALWADLTSQNDQEN